MAKKPKKPKAPKASASLQVWENYKKRLADWKKACQKVDSDKKKKSNIIAQARKMA